MNKFICKIILYTVIVFSSLFVFFNTYLDGFCVAPGLLGNALYNSLGIASEYLVSRAGRSIVNGNEISANIDGINSGTIQPDYIDINAKSFGINTPIDASYILQNAQDLDVSHMSPSELTQYLSILSDDPNATNGNTFFKKCAIGGVTLYWAVNQYGEWVGSTLDNIMASFDTTSQSLTTNIETTIDNTYSNNIDNVFITSGYSFHDRQNTSTRTLNLRYKFNADFFLYNSSGLYIVSNTPLSLNQVIGHGQQYYYDHNDPNSGFNGTSLGDVGILNTAQYLNFTIANNNYYVYEIGFQKQGNSGFSNYYPTDNFGTLNDIKAYITQYGYTTKTYNAELVDSSNDGYTVPDIGANFAGIISDIYNVIDSLRDGIIGSLNDDLTLTLDDSLAASIADAIADAISRGLAITDEMHGGNGGGSTEDPDWSLPEWIIPPFIQDLFPEGTFELFRPIFYIVPDAYSSYSLWILIPTIIVFVIFIYFVVSVL